MHTNDELPDLGDLLIEARGLAQVRAAAKVEAGKIKSLRESASSRHGLTPEDLARLRDWENKHEWRAVANVARFREQECSGCGDYQYLFEGLFQRQDHRHISTARRWVAVEVQQAELPNEIQVDSRVTPMCGECCELRGFSWAQSYYQDGKEHGQQEVEVETEVETSEQLPTTAATIDDPLPPLTAEELAAKLAEDDEVRRIAGLSDEELEAELDRDEQLDDAPGTDTPFVDESDQEFEGEYLG